MKHQLQSKRDKEVQARFRQIFLRAGTSPAQITECSELLSPYSSSLWSCSLMQPAKDSQNSFCPNIFSALFNNSAVVQQRLIITGSTFSTLEASLVQSKVCQELQMNWNVSY